MLAFCNYLSVGVSFGCVFIHMWVYVKIYGGECEYGSLRWTVLHATCHMPHAILDPNRVQDAGLVDAVGQKESYHNGQNGKGVMQDTGATCPAWPLVDVRAAIKVFLVFRYVILQIQLGRQRIRIRMGVRVWVWIWV